MGKYGKRSTSGRHTYWEHDRRFEELDTDSDDGQEVGLDGISRGGELLLLGADSGSKPRQRRTYSYSDSEDTDDSDMVSREGHDRGMQLALRDKEHILLDKALQRIQRAQALGKKNVRLSQPELNALQRKRREEGQHNVHSKPKDRHRSNGRSNKSAQKDKPHERKHDTYPSNYEGQGSPKPLGVLRPSPLGTPSYAPLGYYPPPATVPQSKSSRPGSRSTSSKDLARASPGLSRFHENRTLPFNASTRSLPDDPHWMPRPRSSSSLSNAPYPPDSNYPYNYQAYSPPLPQMPVQYASHARRIVSTPQPDTRTRQPRYEGLGIAAARQEHSSPVPQRENRSEPDSENDDDSEEGVQVDVVPAANGRGYEIRTVSENSVKDKHRRRR
ncbi:MAG: hypothetical protein Q9163_005996 [Psora crenata]